MSAEGYVNLALLNQIHSAQDLQSVVGRLSKEKCTAFYGASPFGRALIDVENFDPSSFFNEVYQSCEDPDEREYVYHSLTIFRGVLGEALQDLEKVSDLFLKAFKCHQKAIAFFQSDQVQEAISEMDKTRGLVVEIIEPCMALHATFSDLQYSLRKDKDKPLTTASSEVGTLFSEVASIAGQLGAPTLGNPQMIEHFDGAQFHEVNKYLVYPLDPTIKNLSWIEGNFLLSFSKWLSLAKVYSIAKETTSQFNRALENQEGTFALLDKLDQNW